jgi:AcrR family transcriptional regulator
MTKIDQQFILEKTAELYSRHGYENFSIRKLAKDIHITHSVIYHYYADEETLLRAMFTYVNQELGKKRSALPDTPNSREMLKQRIVFQLDNAYLIVAVLKYYLAHRLEFKRNGTGYVPDKSALHIEEVLKRGQETKEFTIVDLESDAKVMTHAINGFLLEYHPNIPDGKEKDQLAERIYSFLIRALEGGESYKK